MTLSEKCAKTRRETQAYKKAWIFSAFGETKKGELKDMGWWFSKIDK